MYSKELTEKKNDLITRAEGIVGKAKTEKRELTEDELKEIAKIRDDVRRIKETLGIVDDMDREQAKQEKPEPPAQSEGKEPSSKTDEEAEKEEEQQQVRAFENYLRNREVHERAGELTVTDNGAVIPKTIANKIIKTVYDISPILRGSTKYNVKGKITIPVYTEGITVAYQDEFSPLTSSNGSFTNIDLDGFLAGALSKISNSLINNSQFNIVDFVVSQMGEAIARFIEKELLIGTPGKVTGMSNLGTLKAAQILTAASATAITADEIIAVQENIKDFYQTKAMWIMSPKTRTAIRTLKDGNGRYLLNDDITAPFGKTLLGKPVYTSDNMPNIETDKTVIYYGDPSCLATKFSENINIQILREKYADEHATGVIGWFEFDSKVENAQGLAALKMN